MIAIYDGSDTIIIYDRNDSGLYNKTTIIVATSIDYDRRIIIYDPELCSKQKRNLLS